MKQIHIPFGEGEYIVNYPETDKDPSLSIQDEVIIYLYFERNKVLRELMDVKDSRRKPNVTDYSKPSIKFVDVGGKPFKKMQRFDERPSNPKDVFESDKK